jgi:glycosyltransferase involved in cell wall biosynthesis
VNIFIILDHAHINGGQAKVALESAIGLRQRGHAVTVFTAVSPIAPSLIEAGVKVICLEQDDIVSAKSKLTFAVQTIWNRKAMRALKEALAPLDPLNTLVHVHGWAKALSPSIGRALKSSGLPIVYTMHEFFLVCPNGGFYDYQQQKPCLRVPLSLNCISCNCDSRSYAYKALRLVRQGLLDYVSGFKKAIHHLIIISHLQYEVSKDYIPLHIKLHKIDNPISAVPLGPKTDVGDTFLYVGRLSPEKGIHLFLEAARRVGIKATVIGDGPSSDDLQQAYPEADFLGWKSADEVLTYMRAARVLVFPSVWYEGQPLTVYEALSMGTPVIVSGVCAGREAIVDGENGYTFATQNVNSLAQKLAFFQNDAHVRDLSQKTYARYWANPLSVERHLDSLETLYAAVLLR